MKRRHLTYFLSASPVKPEDMDWSPHYPEFHGPGKENTKKVEFADIGCGYGGLMIELAKEFPDTLIMGKSVKIMSKHIERLKCCILYGQAWRSEPRLRNTSTSGSRLFEASILVSSRMSPSPA